MWALVWTHRLAHYEFADLTDHAVSVMSTDLKPTEFVQQRAVSLGAYEYNGECRTTKGVRVPVKNQDVDAPVHWSQTFEFMERVATLCDAR